LTLLEREGGQSLSGLAAACSNSTWMNWRVVEPTGAAQTGAAEECLSWGAVSRTGAPNSTATPQDGHPSAPRRWSDRLRFLPALHKWVVAELDANQTVAAARAVPYPSPKLKPPEPSPSESNATVGRAAGHSVAVVGAAALGSSLVDECAFVAKHRVGAGAPPVVAFLVGLEGSGHHIVETVVGQIVPKVENFFWGAVDYWKDLGEPAGTKFLTWLEQHPGVHFFGQWSYPAGPKGRHDVDARVSLVKLVSPNLRPNPNLSPRG